jgi:hypothetical protein
MSDTQSFEDRAGYAFEQQGAPPGLPEWMQAAAAAPPSLSNASAGQGKDGGGQLSDQVMQALEHAQQQGDTLMAGQRANTAKTVAEIEKSRKDIESVPLPKLGKSPEAPKANLGQGMMEFLQVATVMSAIAGGLARRNATVALTAFAGAVKGFTEGKKEEFQSKLEEWKAATEQLKADNQAKLDQYDLVLKNKKLSADMKLASLKLIAQQYSDEMMYNLAERRDITSIAMLNQRDKEFTQSLELKYKNSQIAADKAAAQIKVLEQFGGATRSQGMVILRQKVNDFVEKEGRQPTGDEMQKMAADIGGAMSYERSAGSQAARVESASNEVKNLVPLAIASSRELPRGKFVPFNELLQKWQAGTSDPHYNTFMINNFSLMNAYARAMNPTGQPRVTERLEAKAAGVLNMATDQKSYEAQVRALWQEVQASKKAVSETRGGVGEMGDFPEPANDGWSIKVKP